MSGTENQQPSLVGGHAEYVKGAAEVSLLSPRCSCVSEEFWKVPGSSSLDMIPSPLFTNRALIHSEATHPVQK